MRIHTAAITAAILAATLTACSSNDDGAAPAASASSQTASPTPSSTPTVALDAERVVKALTDAIADARSATVYTAATDPNQLLGRPGGYLSKADFTDGRAKPNIDDEVQNGGSVEVYADPAEARERSEFITTTLDRMKIFGREYHYLSGGILLRVSGALTPDQATEYEAALKQLG